LGKTVGLIVAVVAAVVIAVAAPYLAPLALAAVGIAATTTAIAIATAVIGIALSVGLSLAMRAAGLGAPKAKNQIGPPQVFRQAITDSFIAYGKRRLGGLLVFFHSRQDTGGAHYRYFVVACAGHRCQGVVSWMLNDEVVTIDGSNKVTSGKYANNAWLWFQRGLASETANATFVSECGGKWTTGHKGNGVAAIYAKFKLTDDVVSAGMPNITTVVEGRDEILDPRDASTGYTDNAALVFYDWMKMPREEGGFGAYADEIPDDSWISAQANVCDEDVAGTPRYTINAVLTTGAAPAEVRDAMIVNMAGTYTFSAGKHLMRPGYWVPVSVTLSEDDLAGPIEVSPFFPADTAANQVQGTFIDPASGYQGAPFTTQAVEAADIKQIDLDLAFTTNLSQADRIAAIMLKRAQCEKTVLWPMNIMGLNVAAMSTVQLDSSRYGLSNYAWTVSNWALSADYGAVLSLREENEEIYDDGTPATPVTPPTVVQPTEPVSTTGEVMATIANSYITELSFSVDTSGNVTVSDHNRVYVGPAKTATVAVTGATVTAPGGTASGDVVAVYYDDPTLAGGAVTYQMLVLPAADVAAGTADSSPSNFSATNPYRHQVGIATVPATGTTTGGTSIGSGGGAGGSGGGWGSRQSSV
jgi:hypothetical protein